MSTADINAHENPGGDGFAQIVEVHYRRVTIVALAITGDIDMAEDIAQETFLRAWLKFDTLRDPAMVLPWLNRIASNTARLWNRSGQTRSRLLPLVSLEEIIMEPPDSASPSPRDSATKMEENLQLSRAVMDLPEELREVVLLHYAEGMTASDIARISGESPSTVTRRLERARARLRDHLESGLAASLASMKPRKMQRALAVIGAAAALPPTSRAKLLHLASDTPPAPPASVNPAAPRAAFKETGIMKTFIAKISAAKLATVIGVSAILGGGIFAVTAITSDNGADAITRKAPSSAETRAVVAAGLGDVKAVSPGRTRANQNGSTAKTDVKNNRARAAATTATQSEEKRVPEKTPVGYVMVSGTVYEEGTSTPLGSTRILASTPAEDMRQVRKDPETSSAIATVADDSGSYELQVPLYDEVTSISLDAMIPGYRSLAGSYYSGGDFSKHGIPVTPEQRLSLDLVLPRAAYFGGRVVDEAGNPVSKAVIASGIEAGGSYGVSGFTTSDDGYFQIFDFPETLDRFLTSGTAMLKVTADDKESTVLEDLFAIPESERANLEIVMTDGSSFSGQLLDASGSPVARHALFIEFKEEHERRQAVTDESGYFTFKGLKPGKAEIGARIWNPDQQLVQELEIPVSGDVTLRLVPSPRPDESQAVNVLGMELLDLTPELAAAYKTHGTTGVLVLNYGPNAKRLGVISDDYQSVINTQDGSFGRGDLFFVAGNKRIGSVKEFVEEILRVNELPEYVANEGQKGMVRVVYNFNWFRASGSNTQHLKLTPEDAAELKQFYQSHYGD